MQVNQDTRYTFGHSDVAGERLEKISKVFNPFSAKFIEKQCPNRMDTVIDLGCGPGYSTEMLANSTQTKTAYGLDMSEMFVQEAKRNFPAYQFICHDITVVPFPVQADLLYCKFLLSHLTDLEILFGNWMAQLNNNGLILCDELEDINTDIQVFKRYLDVSNQLIKSQRANLYIGKKIHAVIKKFNVICDQTEIIPVENRDAASLFFPNTVSIWNTDEFVRNLLPEEERKEISEQLFKISQGFQISGHITWKMKRIVLKNLKA